MVKYADYTVLCCFVFPLGFAIPTFLALLEGREEREKGLCCSPLRHREAFGAGGAVGNSITHRRMREKVLKPIPAACCLLLFQEAGEFLFSIESFPRGKDRAHWEAPGNLETKPGEASAGNKTKPYARALPGRAASQMSPRGYSPTRSPFLLQNRGGIAFRQLPFT